MCLILIGVVINLNSVKKVSPSDWVFRPDILFLNMIVCFISTSIWHRLSKLSNSTVFPCSRSNPSKVLLRNVHSQSLRTQILVFEFYSHLKYVAANTFWNVIFSTNQKHSYALSYAVWKQDVIVAETILRHKMKSVESDHKLCGIDGKTDWNFACTSSCKRILVKSLDLNKSVT